MQNGNSHDAPRERLVPVQPTEEMVDAGVSAIYKSGGEGTLEQITSDALAAYEAMISKAPLSETVPTPASPAATPRTDLFALEKMYQASAGVLAEDEAISQLLDFARTLERENADLLVVISKCEQQRDEFERISNELRRQLAFEQMESKAAAEQLQASTQALQGSTEVQRKLRERAEAAEAKLATARQEERERCARVLEGEIFPVGCFSKESPIVEIVKAAQAAIRALKEST